jgi:hypothetical protein
MCLLAKRTVGPPAHGAMTEYSKRCAEPGPHAPPASRRHWRLHDPSGSGRRSAQGASRLCQRYNCARRADAICSGPKGTVGWRSPMPYRSNGFRRLAAIVQQRCPRCLQGQVFATLFRASARILVKNSRISVCAKNPSNSDGGRLLKSK